MMRWRAPRCVHVGVPIGDDRFGLVRCRASAELVGTPGAKRVVLMEMISESEACGGRLELDTVHACWCDETSDVVWWIGRMVRRADA